MACTGRRRRERTKITTALFFIAVASCAITASAQSFLSYPATGAAFTNTLDSPTLAPGTLMLIRLWDDSNSGDDHGLAVNRVRFSAVPTPGGGLRVNTEDITCAAKLVGIAALLFTELYSTAALAGPVSSLNSAQGLRTRTALVGPTHRQHGDCR